MSAGFVLLETVAGREREVCARIARVPGLGARSVLFESAVAVRVDGGGASLSRTAARLRRFGGVTGVRAYPVRAWASGPGRHSPPGGP